MPKKILIAGLGGVGQRHIRNIRQLLGPGIDLIAYRQRGLAHIITNQLKTNTERNVEEEYGLRVYAKLDEALNERPDIALICNPNRFHLETALQAAKAGCHLFIEKPLSDTSQGIKSLIDIVRKNGLTAMVAYQMRYHPCIIRLQEMLAAQLLGTILSVRSEIGEYLPNWHPYEDYRHMYAARSDLGGGVVLSQIHEYDYLYSMFGLPGKIFAIGGHWSHLAIDVEDTATVLMQFSYEGRPLPVYLHQDYLQNPPRRSCEIIGDRARVFADLRALTVTLTDAQGNTKINDYTGFDRNNMFLAEMRHFLDCIENSKKPAIDLYDGFQSLRMALAVKQSIHTGSIVDISEDGFQ